MIDKELLNKLYKKKEQELNNILEPMPQTVPPVVTQTDAESGYLTRYFTRSVTDEDYIVEIDKKQHQILKNNPRFVTTTIKWKIKGQKETMRMQNGINLYGVEDINRIAVANADLTFGGLRKYITSYMEYWISET